MASSRTIQLPTEGSHGSTLQVLIAPIPPKFLLGIRRHLDLLDPVINYLVLWIVLQLQCFDSLLARRSLCIFNDNLVVFLIV
jgi:hypothetical protein